jgi:hypothetical protein
VRIAYPWRLGVAAFTVMVGCLLAPPASAATPLGGGAGIIVDGTYCTLTIIGHDKTGDLVGFTAAHCGGPGAQVVAEGSEDHGPLGTVAAANDAPLDYSVIKFDPAKVTPIPDFAGFVISGIGDAPAYRQPACKLGAATGYFCSGFVSIPGRGRHSTFNALWLPGDDGGPIVTDGLLIAMMTGGWVIPGFPGMADLPETHTTLFAAILDDVNTTGGPGAGFVPIPG